MLSGVYQISKVQTVFLLLQQDSTAVHKTLPFGFLHAHTSWERATRFLFKKLVMTNKASVAFSCGLDTNQFQSANKSKQDLLRNVRHVHS